MTKTMNTINIMSDENVSAQNHKTFDQWHFIHLKNQYFLACAWNLGHCVKLSQNIIQI